MEPSICEDLLDTAVEYIPNSAANLVFFFSEEKRPESEVKHSNRASGLST